MTTRKAILTLAATETGATEMVEITLTQAGAARQLSADKTSIDVAVDAGEATFNVTANVPWRINKRVTDTFITTISPKTGNNNQEITISYEENTAITIRDAILTLEATGAGATEMVNITINQAAAARKLTVDNATINVNADQTSATFNVTANVPWEITNSDTWVTSFLPETGSDNQEITITYQENTAITSRDAVFTLATTDAGATISVTITLTQAAAARTLSADKTNITVLDAAGSVTFNVIANVPWGITQASTASWISDISPETGSANQQITITYEQNTTGASREAILTLAATETGETETLDITLTQSEAGARVLSAAPSILSPTAAAGNITFEVVSANVDWGITKRAEDTFITISPEYGNR